MAHKVNLNKIIGGTLIGAAAKSITPKIPDPKKLPDVPTTDDPAVAAAKEKLRLDQRRRRGRRASILTSNRGVQEDTGVIKRSSSLGGNPEKLATV